MTTNKNCAHHRYPQDCDPSCAEIQRLRTDLAAANASTPSESRRTYTLSDDGLRKLIAAMGRLGPTISAGIVADLIDTRAAEASLAAKLAIARAALKMWVCDSCLDGQVCRSCASGRDHVHVPPLSTCPVCNGTGTHPLAAQALKETE